MPPPPENARVAVVDRFPVTATAPDGHEYRAARIILTRPTADHPGWCWIWRESRPEPELLVDAEWSTPTRGALAGMQPGATWLVDTPDGVWRIDRAGGCGCGSVLKRMVPWTPMRRGRL